MFFSFKMMVCKLRKINRCASRSDNKSLLLLYFDIATGTKLCVPPQLGTRSPQWSAVAVAGNEANGEANVWPSQSSPLTCTARENNLVSLAGDPFLLCRSRVRTLLESENAMCCSVHPNSKRRVRAIYWTLVVEGQVNLFSH